MIISHIIGGLGNQLFQYAMARKIAYANKYILKLDISDFSAYNLREYKLDRFNIVAEIASAEEVLKFRKNRSALFSKAYRAWNSLLPLTSRSYVQERFFTYDPETARLPDNIYLEGHWPSEKYFLEIEPLIRRELTLKSPMDDGHAELKKEAEETSSVSLHIRRGDYVSNPVTNRVHGTCSPEYYEKAVELIAQSVPDPHFFIFSDDPAWVREHFSIPYPATIVSGGDEKDTEDLMVMSSCKHHIIANSSFSWWGAWLNPRKEKIVISPARWYQGAGYDTRDLLPDSWITI